MDLRDALSGVTCPLVTPMADGSIDEDALVGLVDHVVSGGIDGLFPCGTTGEFASLAPDERRRVIELAADRAPADVPVVAGAAATSVDRTLEYVEAAAEAGADAAAVVHPYFHRANEPAGDRRFFEAVADDSVLPLVLYNIPVCTGGEIDVDVVADVAGHDAVVGMKDSSGDPQYLGAVRDRTPADFLVLQGFDAQLVDALRSGADGGINALSNVFPGAFRELYDRVDDPRAGTLQQEVIAPLFEHCTVHGFAPATKAALVARGTIPADDVRPPLVPVADASEIEGVVEDAIDVLEA